MERMQYTSSYESPLGRILLACDDKGLTGLWFEGQKYYGRGLGPEHEEKEQPALKMAKRWLDLYFSGREPDFLPPLHMVGSDFSMEVWNALLKIPYGNTATYGELARVTAAGRGLKRMSPQAVGGAVGHNRISIIVPCHRVVGADGSLTGYAGGLHVKEALLRLEGADMDRASGTVGEQ